jgi:hypothetical protein
MVVCHSIDRLSRQLTTVTSLATRLADAGVRLVTDPVYETAANGAVSRLTNLIGTAALAQEPGRRDRRAAVIRRRVRFNRKAGA